MKYTLENVEVKKTCSIDWETMRGGVEVRHCDKCLHNVYNISEMPKRRALKVLSQKDDSICVRYYLDDRNRVVTQSYFGIFRRNLYKAAGAMLAIIFSFTSLQAMQIKTSKPKKKKVVKHRNYKKPNNAPRRTIGKPNKPKQQVMGPLE